MAEALCTPECFVSYRLTKREAQLELTLNPPVVHRTAPLSIGLTFSANSIKKASLLIVLSFLCSKAIDSYDPPESSMRSKPASSSCWATVRDSSSVRPPSAKSAEFYRERAR